MWEETETYQNASFRATLWLVAIGTLLIGIVGFMIGEYADLKNWLKVIVIFVGAWLIIAGVVYLIVKLLGFGRPKAKQPAPQTADHE